MCTGRRLRVRLAGDVTGDLDGHPDYAGIRNVRRCSRGQKLATQVPPQVYCSVSGFIRGDELNQ